MSEILGVGRLTLHEGRLEAFKRLAARAMEIVRTMDTGTLQYDLFLNEDQSECYIVERYRDSDALMEHATHVGEVMAEIFATGAASSALLGEPSDALRAMMGDNGPVVFTPFLEL